MHAVTTTAPFRVSIATFGTSHGFPNNARSPLVIYYDAFVAARDGDGASRLVANGWTRPWAWGVFDFHHYHSCYHH